MNPKNALIRSNGEIKLIDFGSSRMGYHHNNGNSTSVKVTEGYAPPEQYYTRGNQGPWTDVYALAATFYRLVSNIRLPSSLERQSQDAVKPLYLVNRQVSRRVSDVIDRAMQLNYTDRYQTMDAFLADFSPAVGNAPGMTVQLTVSGGIADGTVIPLHNGDRLLFGRKSSEPTMKSIPVSNESVVSREHCYLSFSAQEGCVTLEDVSKNGTYLGSGSFIHHSTVRMFDNTVIRLSTSNVRIHITFIK